MDTNFWEWFVNLDPYTMELVLFDVVRETQEKGRELTEEELNEIRAKYETEEQEEENDGETDAESEPGTDGTETETEALGKTAGGWPKRDEENVSSD